MAIDSVLSLADPLRPKLASPDSLELLEVEVYPSSSDWGEGACCCRVCNLVVRGCSCGCSSTSESGVSRKREANSLASPPLVAVEILEAWYLQGVVVCTCIHTIQNKDKVQKHFS